ncbi:MAG TPA: hypothetical protein PKD26_02475 [Pyrinomonadaceae bacterium]|nr:hypothetical protein [Pyrinomonadaceae bacterium]
MVRNILGLIAGYVVGSIVNFALIMVNMTALAPAGADFSTPEGVNAAMASLQPINFAVVFLAHALGTLAGAFTASMIAVSHKMLISMIIGCLFLIGGIYAAYAIEAPMWFEATDLLLAYIPMAWLGAKFAGSLRGS